MPGAVYLLPNIRISVRLHIITCDGYNLGSIIGAVLLGNQVHHSSWSE